MEKLKLYISCNARNKEDEKPYKREWIEIHSCIEGEMTILMACLKVMP